MKTYSRLPPATSAPAGATDLSSILRRGERKLSACSLALSETRRRSFKNRRLDALVGCFLAMVRLNKSISTHMKSRR